ncbi:hypothetical protein BDW59DRAFT_155963 [Aspergillus cavernicola]|uniref:Uncharacterized protein n=1 Tax=Aspergillus cavernicola TaxID=176166 RepID=A0ABR4J535_9EURO
MASSKDSKANIYGFAIVARRMGWKDFVVADELTKRQLWGELRPKDDDSPLSVVLIMIRQRVVLRNDIETLDKYYIRVSAKRQLLRDDEAEPDFNIFELLDTFQVSCDFMDDSHVDSTEHLYEYGLELNDPSRGVFELNNGAITGREELEMGAGMALSATTPLPSELVNYIVGMLYNNDERPFDTSTLPGYDNDFAFNPLDAQLYCNSTRSRTAMENKSPAIPSAQVFLIPPVDTKATSRSGFISLEVCQLGSVYHSGGGYSFIWPNTRKRMLENPLSPHCNTYRATKLLRDMEARQLQLLDPREAEIFYQADQPFYSTSADGTTFIIPLIHLTNKLTGEQVDALEVGERHIHLNHFDRMYRMIPWRDGNVNAPDGTMHDVWGMFCELHEEGVPSPYFFIDQQSGVNQTVMVVKHTIN